MRVLYHLKIPAGKRAEAERAIARHPSRCPAAVTLGDALPIAISGDIQEE